MKKINSAFDCKYMVCKFMQSCCLCLILSLSCFIITVEEYCKELASSLSIKIVTTVPEIDTLISKKLKRKANMLKDEKAKNPNAYLSTFEAEDAWNHVGLCHSISSVCYKRSDCMQQLRTAIEQNLKSSGSPIVVHGESFCGKTWLAAQLPQELGESCHTIVRFCSLTKLTRSLSNLLYGISKQLQAIIQSQTLPVKSSKLSTETLAELFVEMMLDVSSRSDTPVVIVLDGLDKLGSSIVNLSQFLKICTNQVPEKVCLVVTLREPEQNLRNAEEYLRNLLTKDGFDDSAFNHAGMLF